MSDDEPRSVAVTQLEQFGLSAYAARTFVALVSLGAATARDVSATADIPRTRVYDAAEELQCQGLVEVEESSPKRFHPVTVVEAGKQFEREYLDRVYALTEALDTLEEID